MESVTVVIPAKNEAASIGAVIDGARAACGDVLVVDGNSDDGTAAVALAHGARVIRDEGRGKGLAIRAALPHLSRPVTVFMDGDASHDPRMIASLVAPIEAGEADHVTGSRLLGGSSELHGGFDEFMRLTGSSFITALINWRCHVRLSDSQNGFRAIRTDVLRQLNLTERITTIEQEMIVKTLRGGWRMAEVPAHESKRAHGVSHVRLGRVWFRYGYSLVKHLYFSRPRR